MVEFAEYKPARVISELPTALMKPVKTLLAVLLAGDSVPSELILKAVMAPLSAVKTNSVGKEGGGVDGGGVPGGGGVEGGVVGEGVGLDTVCDPPQPARIHRQRSNTHAVIFEVVMMGLDGSRGRIVREDASGEHCCCLKKDT